MSGCERGDRRTRARECGWARADVVQPRRLECRASVVCMGRQRTGGSGQNGCSFAGGLGGERMARRAGNASDALRPCFPVNRKRGLRRGKYSWVLLGRECMGAVRATWRVPWLLAVVILLRLGRVCSTSLRVPSYHQVGLEPQVPTTLDGMCFAAESNITPYHLFSPSLPHPGGP